VRLARSGNDLRGEADMNVKLWFSILVLATASGAVPAQTAAPAPVLEAVRIKGVDRAERVPGTDWKAYDKVFVQPVDVAFSRGWSARDYGTFGLSSSEVGRMRASLAELTQSVFKDVLREGGFTLVDAPGEGVLAVKPDIVDLYVAAPDAATTGRGRSYVMNAGEMRLALELSDSVTGTVLARASDRKRGRDSGQLEWANSTYNRAEAERALRGWAVQLRNVLTEVRQAPR
jgi:hypothetical protein